MCYIDIDLTAQAVLFFIAAFETVSTVMSFTLYELAVHPDVQERLFEEIREHKVQHEKLDFTSIQQMTYLDMVVSEVLRLWPPGLRLDRICVKDYNMGKPNKEATEDFIIRKGEILMVPTWSIHRDPQFFPNPNKLKKSIDDFNLPFEDDTVGNIIINFIQTLESEMNKKFCNLENEPLFTISTFLDPRYKNKFFSDIVKDRVNTEIVEVALNLFNNNRITSDSGTKRSRPSTYNTNEPSTSADWPASSSKSLLTNLAGILDSSSDEGSDLESETKVTLLCEIKAQMKAFLKEKRACLEENPLEWWKGKFKYDKLAYLARKFLSVPPASVPSEHLFSGAGLIYEPLRNRLMGDKAAKLLFLKYNLPLLKFDY